ncbi:MAG: NTP transferase domain-containing protein [Prevotella sp.]|nr:NTP transferase domain-containing protein [Prevotella sp.]
MQAMIFAAGKGTRLKPLTDVIPKALVPVGDMPLLQRIYLKVLDAGAGKVVVNVHHHAPQLKNYCSLLSARYGVEIGISDESDRLLETGGGIKKARSMFSPEPVLIHNCDILSNVNLRQFYEAGTDADALLLVSERNTSRYLLFSEDMRLVGWTNVQTGEVKTPYRELPSNVRKLAFAGIHVMNPTMFPLMDEWGDAFPIIDFYLRHCAEMRVQGYVQPDLRLLDVGKLDTLENAADFLNALR